MTVSKSSILIVDDDPELRQVIAEILELEGHEVSLAANGAEALAAIERHPPSLVLLDVNLPVIDGKEVARRLKDRGIHLPIIIMTAGPQARRTAEEIKAEGYLAKPFDLPEVLSTIERVTAAGHSEFRFDRVTNGQTVSAVLRLGSDRVTLEIGPDREAPAQAITCTAEQWQVLRWAVQLAPHSIAG